jgi:hypothetical protein
VDSHPVDVWHDRAVCHFLTDPRDRAAYRSVTSRIIDAGRLALAHRGERVSSPS